jgi:small GTP-binding protein
MSGKRNYPKDKKQEIQEKRLHAAFKLRHTLRGYSGAVDKMALSPDGRILASPLDNGTIKLWDVDRGTLLNTLRHGSEVYCIAWSPNGQMLASAGKDKNVRLWNIITGKQFINLEKYFNIIFSLKWSSDGQKLAGCGIGPKMNKELSVWDVINGRILRKFEGRIVTGFDVSWSPKGNLICLGVVGKMVRMLDTTTGRLIGYGNVLEEEANVLDEVIYGQISKSTTIGYYNRYLDQALSNSSENGFVSITWSPNGQLIASASRDLLVRIWDPQTGTQIQVLEGHTNSVEYVSFFDDGRLLVSLSEFGTVMIWRTDSWEEIAQIDLMNHSRHFVNLGIHSTLPVMATPAERGREIDIWELDLSSLRQAISSTSRIHYINAKVVLLGESSVGKSGLGIRIAEGVFRPTESTHGAQFWHIPVNKVPGITDNLQAEFTLWDLAGQPEYRLVHQLFLDDTDAALLLFDCSDPNDPFRGVPYWSKVLKKHAPGHAIKLLVSARCDVSPVTADRRHINQMLDKYGLDEYIKTSAKEGEGIEELYQKLLEDIPWRILPRTSTPRLFQIIRDFLLKQKESGETLIPIEAIHREVAKQPIDRCATHSEVETVIALLQARGLVYRLDPRPEMTLVLTHPELINKYASSIIQAARNNSQGIGAVQERNVLIGDITLSGFERLPHAKEIVILEATVELLIRHDLCFREMGYLVFPSQLNVTRPTPQEPHPRADVTYRFSGSIETIYASLVVRLSYTNYFRREDQWKYAVEFSRGKERLGFSMHQAEEGTGEMEIYFQNGISEFDRVTFIRFVTDHLVAKGIDIQEEIRLYCHKCGKEVKNREAIEIRVKNGFLDIPCQYCAKLVLIPKSIEERYRSDDALVEKQHQLRKTVELRTEKEIKQFKADQQQYIMETDRFIHILHISDFHLENRNKIEFSRTQLEVDLNLELGVKRLEYLVISGDIANHAIDDEYDAAFEMIDSIVKRFGLDADRVIVVPGNHDLNWDSSEEAYQFVPKRKLPKSLPKGKYISAGDLGAFLRDDDHYKLRFANYNTKFFKKIYGGNEYSLEYQNQGLIVERPEDQILIVSLNSCWQIDHNFKDRADIHTGALSKVLDHLHEGDFDNWLKIAVWHHPITGKEMMNDEFMQLLAVHGFQICMHGHIHESIEAFHKYDDKRGIHIIGAGCFIAPPGKEDPEIPLQYNLLTFDPASGEMVVNTRRKEKPNGAWMADARWGDKNDPKPTYSFEIKNYHHKKDGLA